MKTFNTSLKTLVSVTTLNGCEINMLSPQTVLTLATTLLSSAEEGKKVYEKTNSESVKSEYKKLESVAAEVVKIYDSIDLDKHRGTDSLNNVDVSSKLIGENVYLFGVDVTTITKDGIFSQMMTLQNQLEAKKSISEKLNNMSKVITSEVEQLQDVLKTVVSIYDVWDDNDLDKSIRLVKDL